MGIEAPLESVPAEGIGGLSYGVTPLEMADAYATLANGGIHHEPTAISRVEFPDGDVDEVDDDSGDRVLTEGQAYEVTRILEGVITEGTGAGYTYMGCSAAAGKTGTSEDLSDAWFAGYTPLYSTAVWVGHPQSREATGFGGPTAGPIWASFMSSAVNGDCPEFEVPASLPELDGLKSEHTRSSSEVAPETEPVEEGKKTARRRRTKRRKKAATKAANRPRDPNRPRRRLRPRRPLPRPPRRPPKASAAASPRRPAESSPGLADPSAPLDRWGIADLDCRRCRFARSRSGSRRGARRPAHDGRSAPPRPPPRTSTAHLPSRAIRRRATRRSSKGPTATCG